MSGELIVSSPPVFIRAPAAVVWDILVDLPRYGEWNPLNRRAESQLRIGMPVRLWVDDPALAENQAIFEHRLLVFEPPSHLAWGLESDGLTTRRDQYVDDRGDACVYRSTDRFEGADAAAAVDRYGAAIEELFAALGAALKARAELLHRSS